MDQTQTQTEAQDQAPTPRSAVVLLSGGLDSATCLAIASEHFDSITCLHFSYGQQTEELERKRAQQLVDHYRDVVTEVVTVDYRDPFKHVASGVASDRDSFTTDSGELTEDDGRSTGYVPMRNLHLVATGAAFADDRGADAVFIGVQGGDEDAYPDCRPEFIEAVTEAVNNSLADTDEVSIRAPLLDYSKSDVVERAAVLDVPLEYTYSCYSATDPSDPEPCGECPACTERIEAFETAGIDDPVMVD